MKSQRTVLEVWEPATKGDRDAVRSELDSVLASHHFCNSKRYPALLRFVVENKLAGRADELKERTLGVEVFHRPVDYDTNSDTVVRFTAGEVRKRLAVYYHEHEAAGGIQILLPTGSYVPEFLREPSATEIDAPDRRTLEHVPQEPESFPAENPWKDSAPDTRGRVRHRIRWVVLAMATLLVVGGFAVKTWLHRQAAIEQFWAPTLHEPGTTVICSGGVVFANNNFSGTNTASKETEYPFVSMQIASGISQISGLLERGGARYEVQAASSTPLSYMRDKPIVLLGGYNNLWTLRLVEPLRFHFTAEPEESLVDAEHPQSSWTRDRNKSYASTDDYALVARFHDTTTGSVVVVLAGLGRNGTEVASQFVSSPHYMDELRSKIGASLRDKNIEVILKSNVIGGRTGAPTIEAVHVW